MLSVKTLNKMINVDELIKKSMKSGNKTELRAYKNLKAEIQAFKTAKNAKPYNEAAFIQITRKYCDKLEKAILDFSQAHREDLVIEYRDELEVLKKLLPEPVKKSEIYSFLDNDKKYFDQFLETLEDEDGGTYTKFRIPKKEMGNAIKYLKSQFPQVDGKVISDIIKTFII